jgi:tetratricopeptide (TPR) repeat protein
VLGKPEKALAAALKFIEMRDGPAALRILDELIAYDPFHIHARRARGKLLFSRSDFDGAIADLEIVLLLCRHDDAALALVGLGHLAESRIDAAVEAFTRCLRLNPLNRQALAGLLDIAERHAGDS